MESELFFRGTAASVDSCSSDIVATDNATFSSSVYDHVFRGATARVGHSSGETIATDCTDFSSHVKRPNSGEAKRAKMYDSTHSTHTHVKDDKQDSAQSSTRINVNGEWEIDVTEAHRADEPFVEVRGKRAARPRRVQFAQYAVQAIPLAATYTVLPTDAAGARTHSRIPKPNTETRTVAIPTVGTNHR